MSCVCGLTLIDLVINEAYTLCVQSVCGLTLDCLYHCYLFPFHTSTRVCFNLGLLLEQACFRRGYTCMNCWLAFCYFFQFLTLGTVCLFAFGSSTTVFLERAIQCIYQLPSFLHCRYRCLIFFVIYFRSITRHC